MFYFTRIFFSIETDPVKIKKMLARILSSNEFSALRESWLGKKLEGLSELLTENALIKKLLSIISESLNRLLVMLYSDSSGQILKILLFSTVMLLLLWLFFKVRTRVSLKAEAHDSADETLNLNDPADLEKIARKQADSENFIEAMRLYYRSLLLLLDKRALLCFSPSRTNRENEKILSKILNESFRNNFRVINKVFEDKVYAMRACSVSDFEQFISSYKKCKKEVFTT